MGGIFSKTLEENELETGDHIYSWRAGGIYSHHGIYMGGGKVIHFTPDSTSRGGSSFSSSSSNYTSTLCCSCEALGLRKKTSGVIQSCLDCFLENGSLYRFEYGVKPGIYRRGTCTTEKSDRACVVISRAKRLLENGFGEYDVLRNNCEYFAEYCKTGGVYKDGHGCGQAYPFIKLGL